MISAYCADSATDDRATWETLMANITALVAPGGLFLTAALRSCRSYQVGDKRFPCANVDEHDLRRALAPGFSRASRRASCKATRPRATRAWSSPSGPTPHGEPARAARGLRSGIAPRAGPLTAARLRTCESTP